MDMMALHDEYASLQFLKVWLKHQIKLADKRQDELKKLIENAELKDE
jgi:hypothetical protein